jgi:WD40 repeat protein
MFVRRLVCCSLIDTLHGDLISIFHMALSTRACSHVPGLFAAVSTDKAVSLWDVKELEDNKIPRACGRKEMQVGKLYTVSFYPSSPWLLGCGGSENQLALWDMSSEDTILRRFASRVEGGEEYVPQENNDETVAEAIAGTSGNQERQSKANNKKKGKQKKKVHRKDK